tara:strand:- start:385 stop:549 length:165 start_codon:yes stop_codon:yes gene_type:complete
MIFEYSFLFWPDRFAQKQERYTQKKNKNITDKAGVFYLLAQNYVISFSMFLLQS